MNVENTDNHFNPVKFVITFNSMDEVMSFYYRISMKAKVIEDNYEGIGYHNMMNDLNKTNPTGIIELPKLLDNIEKQLFGYKWHQRF